MIQFSYLRAMISTFSRRVTRTDEGASMVEYALLLALIAVVCIGAVTMLGNSASDKFTTVGDSVSNAGTPTTVAP